MSGSQVTPFLRLLKPPFDAVPWDEAINGNMDTIDAFIARYMAVPNYVGAWANSVQYISGQNVLDITDATIYQCLITHTSSAIPTTFADDRATYPTYWAATTNVITGGTGNTNLTIGSATPLSAKAGDLWWDSVGGQLYILYNDGNSLQWVIANNQAGNVGEAPNDGNTYGRRNSAWTQVSTGNVGRNLIHNSLFNVAQRGAGPFTGPTAAYTLDRWRLGVSLDTLNISSIQLSDADRAAIGDEAAFALLGGTFTGNAGASAFSFVEQPIEKVRRLSGKTVTVSFWAEASTTALKLGVNMYQTFGTGGSPSGLTWALTTAATVTLTNTWARYSVTIPIPSSAGKTFGTNGDDLTAIRFAYSCGATNTQLLGAPVQSGVIYIWGVQLEIGNTATPLEKPDPQQDLAKCQRFFQSGVSMSVRGYASGAGQHVACTVNWPPMRAAPTFAVTNGGTAANISVATFAIINNAYGELDITSNGAADYYAIGVTYNISADL